MGGILAVSASLARLVWGVAGCKKISNIKPTFAYVTAVFSEENRANEWLQIDFHERIAFIKRLEKRPAQEQVALLKKIFKKDVNFLVRREVLLALINLGQTDFVKETVGNCSTSIYLSCGEVNRLISQ